MIDFSKESEDTRKRIAEIVRNSALRLILEEARLKNDARKRETDLMKHGLPFSYDPDIQRLRNSAENLKILREHTAPLISRIIELGRTIEDKDIASLRKIMDKRGISDIKSMLR